MNALYNLLRKWKVQIVESRDAGTGFLKPIYFIGDLATFA